MYHQTPLSHAAKEGYKAVVKVLLETHNPAAISEDRKRDPTSLQSTIEGEYKAAVNWKDHCGWTPLLHAARGGHEAVVKLLLGRSDVDINLKGNDLGWMPLWWIVARKHMAVVMLLLEQTNTSVDSEDNYGQTPLLYPAGIGHAAIVKLLLKQPDIDLNFKGGNSGRTPLSNAAERGHEAEVRRLLEIGNVDVDSKDRKN